MSRAPHRPTVLPSAGRGLLTKPNLIFWVALLAIGNYALLALWYTGLDNFFSYAEPNIASISWTMLQGKPVYHSLTSAEQYSMVYGPYLFVINGLFFSLLGPGILSFKLAEALFAIASVLSVVWAVRCISDIRTGIVAGGFLALTYFSFWPFSTFIARSDALILGLVGMALVAAHGRRKSLSVITAAIALGVCVGIKPHAAMYFLPIWVILQQRFGWAAFFLAGFGAIPIAFAPFVVFPNISLPNYILWLNLVAEHGLDFPLFVGNMRNMLILQILPAVMLLSILPRPMAILKQHRMLVGTFALSMAIVMPVASVTGAGKFHLVPFSIVMVYWFAAIFHEHYSSQAAITARIRGFALKQMIIFGLLTLMVLNAFPVNRRMIKLMNHGGRFNGAVDDIREILTAYPEKSIGMGDGELKSYELSYFRPLLVFAGHPYLIDPVSVMVRVKAGYGVGAQTVSAIRNCDLDIWLIPKGDVPFAIDSIYGGSRQLYPKQFRQAFLKNYRARAKTEYFDLWFCKSHN